MSSKSSNSNDVKQYNYGHLLIDGDLHKEYKSTLDKRGLKMNRVTEGLIRQKIKELGNDSVLL